MEDGRCPAFRSWRAERERETSRAIRYAASESATGASVTEVAPLTDVALTVASFVTDGANKMAGRHRGKWSETSAESSKEGHSVAD